MKNNSDEQTKAIIEAFVHIQAHSLLNLYVCENLAFGKIKPKEKVPFERYFHELGMDNSLPLINFKLLDGDFIEDGCAAEKNFEEVCFYLFKEKAEIIFDKAPVDKNYDDDYDLKHYKYGLYEYLTGAYPLFKRIMQAEISPEPLSSASDMLDWDTFGDYYNKAAKFVSAVKLKKLKQGGKIDRYIRDMPFLSPVLEKLVTVRKGHCYLKNSDTDSLDFKLAMFSCFKFFSPDNAKLFELKTLSLYDGRKY